MIIPGVSLLLYAHDTRAPWHAEARAWWERTLNSASPAGLTWITILRFIRISIHRRALAAPISPAEAIRRVRSWLACPQVQIISPGERHQEILFNLLIDLGTAGNLTTNAHLAALAIEHRGEVASADTDFGRFPGLRWFSPLRPAARKR
jgi:toxin-antitoxin system PIN domain toxin